MEQKRPMTRSLIDELISKVETELEKAVGQKEYTKCPPLQKKLDDLMKKREEFPTIEELRRMLEDAEKTVQEAAATRDFESAASKQAAVTEAKRRLEAALKAEGISKGENADIADEKKDEEKEEEHEIDHGFASRSELELEIATAQENIDKAIAAKDFKNASQLQEELEKLEGLRVHFPTVEELEKILNETQASMDSAIKNKKFAEAESLNEEIAALQDKIIKEKENRSDEAKATDNEVGNNGRSSKPFVTLLDGSEIKFDSRIELETCVQKYEKEVEEAAKAKDFAKATNVQKIVDDLHNLRKELKSLTEMRQELRQLTSEMHTATNSKNFAKAGEIHEQITLLEERLVDEAEREQKLKGTNETKTVITLPTSQQNQILPVGVMVPPEIKVKQKNVSAQISLKENKSLVGSVRTQNVKPVSKLRPKKPLISNINDNVLLISQMLANKRGSASLVIGMNGRLSGILTDTDVTRRVVAKGLDPKSTNVATVMTANPTVVSMDDPAMDALSTMVENRFRHLPVVDSKGAVVGVLDIAKCLNDAIGKLEKAEEKSSTAAEDAVKQMATLQGAGSKQAAMLTQLLGPLMSQAFGNKASPTLGSLLAGKPATIVSPKTSLRDTAAVMAESKKQALVVKNGQLMGIFGFSDMMRRAVAKELDLKHTTVESCMTPNPETVSPDMTIVQALQEMHDNKILSLPVCDNGTVVGLVDVMDLIYGCGGAEGWKSLFDTTMAMSVDEDASDIASQYSAITNSVKSSRPKVSNSANQKPVSKLRPKKPLISNINDNVLLISQMLANKRGSASLVIGMNGRLSGILTDTDVTRRVVAKGLDPKSTNVATVMTANPTVVSMDDPAMDALSTMVENRFRHLPVVDSKGAVVGVLDIAKCLNDAIGKLEKAEEKSSTAAEDAVKQMATLQGAGSKQAAMLTQLLGPLMSQAFGNKASPTLGSLLAGKPATIVSPKTSLRDTAAVMAESKKQALVVKNGQLMGIFGFSDMMRRAVAKELDLKHTTVESCMTPNPETVSPDMTIVQALQEMHDNKILSLPVCDNGTVVGLVDVMDLIYGCGGAEGWKSLFDTTMAMSVDDDGSDIASQYSAITNSVKSSRPPKVSNTGNQKPVSKLRPKKPLISNINDSVLMVSQMLANKRGSASLVIGMNGSLAGILTDTDVTRRVVAKRLVAATTSVSTVMTSNPTVVSMDDPAMDALSTMVENRFRHLPVVDSKGAVVGVLDIAKCLNDAISKLEKAEEKSSTTAEDAVKQMASLQGAGNQQAAMLTQLLGPLMAQAFGGNASPTLRSLLTAKPAMVSPDNSLLDAAVVMAEARKAALVVENGRLLGIFGFKDMMSRAVAKELMLEHTPVSEVMTPNPETVSPDMTVVEALHTMHDNRFLNLPVCESDGTVLGLVGVMDLIYGCGGAEGWRSLFDKAMGMENSDTASKTSAAFSAARASVKSLKTVDKTKLKPVSKLRPKKPHISNINDSVLMVSQMLANKRGSASLVIGMNGSLAGILTDTDVTRRVVAKRLVAATTSVSTVMTSNPTVVSMDDPAMDALSTMVENRFRHLPVVDSKGAVVGVLDIAKCLNDAISKLEKAEEKSSTTAEDAVKQMASLQGAGNQQAAMLTQLLGPLMAQAFGGNASPTLRSLLTAKPAMVSPDNSLLDAAVVMAEARKAALVVENGRLLGIFGFKDMMSRAVAKELMLEHTPVSEVMTPNPETVSPDMTVVEALHTMHDNRFLNLPVCESDGTVLGLVGVMDLIYGCGGAEGWRSLFDTTMDMTDDGNESVGSRTLKSVSHSVAKKSIASKSSSKPFKPVSKLRPRKPVLFMDHLSVFEVSKGLSKKRSTAALITDAGSDLVGIITDHDITRRVVARHMNPADITVASAMTRDPTIVSTDDPAMDALTIMIDNHYRYLPVMDAYGKINGILDIGKCLDDAISKLEKSLEKNSKKPSAEQYINQVATMQMQGASADQVNMLAKLLGPIMAQAFNETSSPTLGSLLAGKPTNATSVSPKSSILVAAIVMAEHHKAALVVDDGVLLGIVSFKDIMSRAIAKQLPLDSTEVTEIMTPDPEIVSPEATIVEAMQLMHENKFLTLPVCDDDGMICGVIDVMDLIYGCGGAEGWRSIFDNAMDMDDLSDQASIQSSVHSSHMPMPVFQEKVNEHQQQPVIHVNPNSPYATAQLNNVPNHVVINNSHDDGNSIGDSLLDRTLSYPAEHQNNTSVASPERTTTRSMSETVFKIVDGEGHTYIVRNDGNYNTFLKTLSSKVQKELNPKDIQLKYIDEEGDEILISSDDCLTEAAATAQKKGAKNVKLTLTMSANASSSALDNKTLAFAGAGVAAVVGIVAMAMMKKK